MLTELPILYSFRRCPYAIRARMALSYSAITVNLREVLLRNKPQAMLVTSPKGTVPILILTDGTVMDESIDIMRWALTRNDPDKWLLHNHQANTLITTNDFEFKTYLDHYKYADRHPAYGAEHYRTQGERFLQQLEQHLNQATYLLGEKLSIADIAIFPFIRQFSLVDKHWFDQSPYPKLQQWLAHLLQSNLFTQVMQKYPPWKPEDSITIIPNPFEIISKT